MPWFVRFSAQMTGVLVVMVLVEFASFVFAREQGINRMYWVPLSLMAVAFSGYVTVRRLPLVWGGIVGAILAGLTTLFSWPLGSFVNDGRLSWPAEAEPVLVLSVMAIYAIFGAIIGVAAGMIARSKRRQRVRRAAMSKLAFGGFGPAAGGDDDMPPSMTVN